MRLDGTIGSGVAPEELAALGVRLVGRPGERLLACLDRAHLSRVV